MNLTRSSLSQLLLPLFRFIFFKAVSGLTYAVGLYLFFDEVQLANSLSLLLFQEILFSFYLNDIRTRKVKKISEYSEMSIFLTSVITFLFVAISYKLTETFMFLSAILLFPVIQRRVAHAESESFGKAIRYENLYTPVSSILFFVMAGFTYRFGVNNTPLLFSRYFFIFLSIAVVVPRNRYKTWLGWDISWGDIPWIVLSILVFKWTLYDEIGSVASEDSIVAKMFLISYDILAMVYGFSVRKLISTKEVHLYKGAMMRVFGLFTIITIVLSVLVLLDLIGPSGLLLIASFAVAALFNFIVISQSKYIKIVYVFLNLFFSILISSISHHYSVMLYVFCLGVVFIILMKQK